MKKNMIRILALALVLILALGIIPLGALAADYYVPEIYFNQITPVYEQILANSGFTYGDDHPYNFGGTIKASDFDSYAMFGGELYDFEGFNKFSELDDALFKGYQEFIKTNPSQEAFDAYMENLFNTPLSFSKSDIKIAAIPSRNDYNSDKEYDDAFNAWVVKYGYILAGYVPHQHKLSRWYSDGTTHWRECLVCKQFSPTHETMFIGQNWCQDGDEDQVCNVCGGHVPYHDITVIDSEGGKITVNRDNASHRMKITADVETNDGYQFVKLHFTKVRPDGSKQEVVRYGSGTSFWTNMPTYPMEVTAEFVKK